MNEPRILDLFCGEGGAAMGYHRAGFRVFGVDDDPKPLKRYPFNCARVDALELLGKLSRSSILASRFDAIHASPPCQRYSDLARRNGNADDWPDLVGPVRTLLERIGLPYVIENVEGAPLRNPITLCGTMFVETRVIRHRLFETNWPLRAPSIHREHPLVFTHDKRKAHYGKLDQNVDYVQVTGGGNCTVANKRDAMGMPWASGAGCNEAIPPAYTAYIGRHLIAYLEGRSL